MKLLKDTFLFEYLDKSIGLKGKMTSYQSVLDDLPADLLEEDLRTIQRRFNFPTKNKVISDLSASRIVPVLNRERISLPASLPAYLMVRNGRPTAIVNFTPYVNKNAEGTELYGDPRQMFALMQTGTILMGCYEKWNTIAANQEICKTGCLIYAKLLAKVIDKLYATNLDPFKSDKVRYIAAKFFLVNLLGKPNSDTVRNIASTVCKTMTANAVEAFDQSLPEHGFDNLEELIDLISVHIEGCSSLEIRTFVRVWTQMYQPSTLLATEYLPYFFHMIFSVSVGAHLNNEVVIDSLLGKDIDKLYNAVSNIIR